MTTLTEGRHTASFVLSEANGNRSREALLIAASMIVLVGHVLGKVAVDEGAISVAAPTFVGTGNGVMTLATPAYSSAAKEGTYKVTAIEATANTGDFAVVRPDGTVDGYAKVGVAYNRQVKFTIADGATDFVTGDEFSLVVTIAAATDEAQYKLLNLSAEDGAEVAVAIALYAVTTGVGETTKIAGIVRDCTVNGKELEWPAGITADQKAAALAQLASQGVIVR